MIFASCYKPPKNTNNELNFEEIRRITTTQKKNPIWTVGDLDLSDIEWKIKSINNYQYPKQEIY